MGYIENVLGEWATKQSDSKQCCYRYFELNAYNGWTSYETWLFNIHDDDPLLSNYVNETWNDIKNNAHEYENEEQAAKELLTRVSGYAKEMTNDRLGIDNEENLFKKDVLMNFMKSVNWLEIASYNINDVAINNCPLCTKTKQQVDNTESKM